MVTAFEYLRQRLDENEYSDILIEHIVECEHCYVLGETYLCGPAEHIKDPELWDEEGNYRKTYGPPVPVWLQRKLIEEDPTLSDFERVLKLSYMDLAENLTRAYSSTLWEKKVDTKFATFQVRTSRELLDG